MRVMLLALTAALCGPAVAEVALRVVSFNTFQGIDNAPADREASGNLLTSLDLDGGGPNTSLRPDVVCLQECRSLGDMQDFRDDFLPGWQVIKGAFTDGFNSNGFFIRPELSVLSLAELSTPGPRRVLRLALDVPDAATPLVIYNAHFKAGQTSADRATREAEANAIANRVAADVISGIDFNDDRIPDLFPTHYLFAGDLNHDDFNGVTIDALLVGGSSGNPTGLNDTRFETLVGAGTTTFFIGDTFSTRSGLDSRYDYILSSDAIFATFDTNGDQSVDQAELNAAGFVYNSFDDAGAQASGDVDATNRASDHAPVVLGLTLPGVGIPGDVDGDGDVDLTDLSLLLGAFGATQGQPGYNPDADLDGDGDVDLTDAAILLSHFGE